MKRKYYDNSKLYEERAKLPKPDGVQCIICGKKLTGRRRKYCSDECYDEWYGQIGIKSWNIVRAIVLKRDNYTCQECGGKGEDGIRLVRHHKIPIKDGGDEFDPDNCITLCEENCHKSKHNKISNILLKNKTLGTFGVM